MRAFLLFLSSLLVCPIFAFAEDAQLLPQAANAPQLSVAPLPRFELRQYRYCGADSDCVKAVNGCCDCANGGEDVAVSKDRLKEFRARFDCVEVPCTEIKATPPCASGVVSCVNHLCEYVPKSKD